jgi:hypothetical protein
MLQLIVDRIARLQSYKTINALRCYSSLSPSCLMAQTFKGAILLQIARSLFVIL